MEPNIFGYVWNFQRIAQNEKLPNWRKLAQSGHPVRDALSPFYALHRIGPEILCNQFGLFY
jgi:hypothetical protein